MKASNFAQELILPLKVGKALVYSGSETDSSYCCLLLILAPKN